MTGGDNDNDKKKKKAEVEVELRQELDELLQQDTSSSAAKGGCGLNALLGWCKSAAGCLFVGSESPKLTDWGIACLRLLLPVVMDHKEGLPPAFCQWLQEHVVPSLFAEAGNVEYNDLTLILVRGLFKQMVMQKHTTTPTAGDDDDVEEPRKKKRGRGRARA